jgi:putative DNA primase/helicase
MGEVIPARKMRDKIRSAAPVGRPPPPESFDPEGRRVIPLDNGKLPEILDQVEIALAEASDLNVMRYAGRLARIYQAGEPVDKNVRRPPGAIMVHPVESAHMVELAGRSATFVKLDARSGEYRKSDCPRRIADSFLARYVWPRLPDLVGFVEAPTITPDVRIIDKPGYDAESGLFCAFGQITGYLRPPQAPTRDQALQAFRRLNAMFDAFPFVDEADRVALIAGILTALLRRVLPAAPLFAITAPSAGTGKTLLCETLAIVATNRRASVMSLGHDDAEFEKRLGGVLLAGDAVISIDNIERALRGDLLCQVATQQFVRLRPLGGSGMLNVPTHALLIATGNNLAVIGDLKRRVLMVRLDAHTERPEQRSFDHDHIAEIQRLRGAIISDALTIVAAYLAAGAPRIDGLYAYGGFEQWDRMVRRPLAWLGCPDPLLTAEGLRESDPDLEAMRLLFSAWHKSTQIHGPATAADVVGIESDHDLREALQVVCAEKINSRRLGFWLRSHRDKIVDGLQLRRSGADDHAKVARWQVVTCG